MRVYRGACAYVGHLIACACGASGGVWHFIYMCAHRTIIYRCVCRCLHIEMCCVFVDVFVDVFMYMFGVCV
jgi:hypothetical protein